MRDDLKKNENIDWQAIILDQKFMDKLQNFADKRFGSTVMAEEAYSVAFTKLIDPAWQKNRLKHFQGTCSPQGFLFSCYRNLLTDYGHKKFGKPHPPVWVKRMGPLWVKIYKLLCLERLVPDAIFSRLQTEDSVDIKSLIDTAVEEILSKVTHCGKKSGEIPHPFNETEDSGLMGHSISTSNEEKIDEKTLKSLLNVLRTIFLQSGDLAENQNTISPDEMKIFSSFSLNISPEQKLLLRMVYQDGKSVAAVARAEDKSYHSVNRTIKKAVIALRQQLEQSGIGRNMIQNLLS